MTLPTTNPNFLMHFQLISGMLPHFVYLWVLGKLPYSILTVRVGFTMSDTCSLSELHTWNRFPWGLMLSCCHHEIFNSFCLFVVVVVYQEDKKTCIFILPLRLCTTTAHFLLFLCCWSICPRRARILSLWFDIVLPASLGIVQVPNKYALKLTMGLSYDPGVLFPGI